MPDTKMPYQHNGRTHTVYVRWGLDENRVVQAKRVFLCGDYTEITEKLPTGVLNRFSKRLQKLQAKGEL